MQRIQADEMLQYMKMTFSEFKNSTHPANGFHRVVTHCCQLAECYKGGRCQGVFPKGTFLTPRLYQDGPNRFGHQLCRVECSPTEYFKLWRQLTQAKPSPAHQQCYMVSGQLCGPMSSADLSSLLGSY